MFSLPYPWGRAPETETEVGGGQGIWSEVTPHSSRAEKSKKKMGNHPDRGRAHVEFSSAKEKSH